MCLLNQLVSGVILVSYYMPDIDMAFIALDCLTKAINHGTMIRYGHSNGASF